MIEDLEPVEQSYSNLHHTTTSIHLKDRIFQQQLHPECAELNKIIPKIENEVEEEWTMASIALRLHSYTKE